MEKGHRIRLRRTYVVRDQAWKVVRSNVRSYGMAVSWEDRSLEISVFRMFHWYDQETKKWKHRTPRGTDQWFHESLSHELYHILLERAKDVNEDHYKWTFVHDNLAVYTARINRIISTGVDDWWRGSKLFR